jgi:hypothetical protein
MKKLIKYKNTYCQPGSPLALAIAESPEAAKKMYDETTERFDAMYSGAKEDRIALERLQKEMSHA